MLDGFGQDRPVLFFGYLDGCPACGEVKRVVDDLERRAAGRVVVARRNLERGEPFPVPAPLVPAFAVRAPSGRFYSLDPERAPRWPPTLGQLAEFVVAAK